jgi:hypothetical protein
MLCYYCYTAAILGVTGDASGVGNANNEYRQQQTQGGPAVAILACPDDCSTNSNSGYTVDMAPNVHWLGYTVKVSEMSDTPKKGHEVTVLASAYRCLHVLGATERAYATGNACQSRTCYNCDVCLKIIGTLITEYACACNAANTLVSCSGCL